MFNTQAKPAPPGTGPDPARQPKHAARKPDGAPQAGERPKWIVEHEGRHGRLRATREFVVLALLAASGLAGLVLVMLWLLIQTGVIDKRDLPAVVPERHWKPN